MKTLDSNKNIKIMLIKNHLIPLYSKNCFNAFWVGGLICIIGQLIFDYCIF